MSASFDVERFESVAATPGKALLRIAGRWRSEQRERLSPPMLILDDGRQTHRLSALPGPEDAAPKAGPDAPAWRAAFSVPTQLLEGQRLVFALDAGQDAIVDLPRPSEGRRSVAPRAVEHVVEKAVLAEERQRREVAERRAGDRRRIVRELEQRLDQERSARLEAERRGQAEARARARLEAEIAAADGSHDDRQASERLARVVAERDALTERIAAERSAALARIEALEADRARARETFADLQRRLADSRPAAPAASVPRRSPRESLVGVGLLVLGAGAALVLLLGVLRLVIAP